MAGVCGHPCTHHQYFITPVDMCYLSSLCTCCKLLLPDVVSVAVLPIHGGAIPVVFTLGSADAAKNGNAASATWFQHLPSCCSRNLRRRFTSAIHAVCSMSVLVGSFFRLVSLMRWRYAIARMVLKGEPNFSAIACSVIPSLRKRRKSAITSGVHFRSRAPIFLDI